jgi:hypothetical protein
VLGRTNRSFPRLWLRLKTPENVVEVESLVAAATQAGTVVDVSGSPAFWGARLGPAGIPMIVCIGQGLERIRSHDDALDWISAEIFQVLSAIGRPCIEFLFLTVRRAFETHQIHGALEALETARQDGICQFLGLHVPGGDGYAALGLWQFHDAFDCVLVPRDDGVEQAYRTLLPLALERRVGVITSSEIIRRPNVIEWGSMLDLESDHPVLLGVRSSDEVRSAWAAIHTANEQKQQRLETYPSGLRAGDRS